MSALLAIRELFGIDGDWGYPEEAMAPWLERFGAIPDVLRQYYTTLGAHHGLNQTQDALVIPDTDQPALYRLSTFLRNDYLVFYAENQIASICGVKADDVTQPDPPVYQSTDGDDWFVVADTISQFLLSEAHMQATFGREYVSEMPWDVTDEQLAAVARLFPSKNADSDLYTGVKFFGEPGTDIMLLRAGDHWIMFFGCEDEECYDALEARLAGIVDASAFTDG